MVTPLLIALSLIMQSMMLLINNIITDNAVNKHIQSWPSGIKWSCQVVLGFEQVHYNDCNHVRSGKQYKLVLLLLLRGCSNSTEKIVLVLNHQTLYHQFVIGRRLLYVLMSSPVCNNKYSTPVIKPLLGSHHLKFQVMLWQISNTQWGTFHNTKLEIQLIIDPQG